jgi:hypothetical protein
MRKIVFIAGPKYEAAAELKRVFPQLVLAMSGGAGAFARELIVLAQQVRQGSFAQFDGLIGHTFFINQKRKRDAGFLAELAGVVRTSQSNGNELCSFILKSLLVFAQLRYVLAAEDSTPVAEKNNNRRMAGPQRS